ncbi:MAG: polysaccharide pyruvyl transferase family protein [Streptosporangiales bacterium]|nr:polysaccharide pyruvyl transferase family protein [Streptosporangiales bacterium]MBO0890680.1 polysaccharide pyruvyl transferase family protein [Acidothermales bacterium]
MTRQGPPRVGLFGLLGSGNLGNDGSLDAVVAFLSERHPDTTLGFLCKGPERVAARYGVPARHLQWNEARGTATGWHAAVLKVVGKVLDPFRTFAWLRRQDLVIVPGMGVLEATLPLRPWGFPYSLFWLCVLGRLAGTRVALVSVGADVVRNRLTRLLVTCAARLAHYRSYRDELSRNAMRTMGVDVTADQVYPDLAFALPEPPACAVVPGSVGVGVMDYRGGDDDRGRADEINRAYVDAMRRFVRRLVDDGRQVRLFVGDEADASVVTEILSDAADRPGAVRADPVSGLDDLMRQMASVETVVATRYHNVLCALKLGKPTLSVGYAVKNDVLMAGMGVGGEFCQSARAVDLDRLVQQFQALEARRHELVATMRRRGRSNARGVEEQFSALSTLLPPNRTPSHTVGTAMSQEVS